MLDLNLPTNMSKALFLDRDGIINVDHGYVHTPQEFHFNRDIFKLLHLFIQNHYILFIVTNQSGIGRGYYTHKDFDHLTQWMLERFKEEDIHIEKVLYCPHTPQEGCSCRKPKTGMIDQILAQYPIDLKKSWMIGDKQSDIDLARNAKIQRSIAISSDDSIQGADHYFKSITACKAYLEANPKSLD